MGFINIFISLFKKKDKEEIELTEKSISDNVAPVQKDPGFPSSDIRNTDCSIVHNGSDENVTVENDTFVKELPSNTHQEPNPTESEVEKGSDEQSSIDAIRAAEEERKKREWLDLIRSKRAKRRKELEKELNILDKQLEYIKQHILAIKEERKAIKKSEQPGFNVPQYTSVSFPPNGFTLPTEQNITSMREYQTQRMEEERRIIEAAENAVLNSIASVRKAITNRDLKEADGGLNLISQQIAFVENQDIRDKVKSIVLSITELRNRLEEEQRAKEEEQRKKEAIEAKLRAEAKESERIEREQVRQREDAAKKERARKYQEELLVKNEAERKVLQMLEGLSRSLKEDEDDIDDFFKANGVRYFYHFTEASNIPLIKQRKGLFSWFYLESHGMKIPHPGGDRSSRNLDKDKGIEDYVRLSLCKSHPMAYQLHQKNKGQIQMVLLKIKVDVAKFDTTLFTDINAADKKAEIGDDCEFIEKNFDFDAIDLDWCHRDDPRFKKRQAEVLVKTYIPIRYIVNLDNPEIMTFNN